MRKLSILLAAFFLHIAHAAPPAQVAQNTAWKNLTPSQQRSLAPLAQDWDSLSPDRQQKWMVISNKFQKMNPEQQKRVQEKMDAWVKLTPKERTAARENYLRSNKLEADQRNQQWQQYQQLPEEQRAQLAKQSPKRNFITNLPTPAESRIQKLPPLKTPHRPHQ